MRLSGRLLLLAVLLSVFGCAFIDEPPLHPVDPAKLNRINRELSWPRGADIPIVAYDRDIITDLDVRKPKKSEQYFSPEIKYVFEKPLDIIVDRRGTIYTTDTGFKMISSIEFMNPESKSGELRLNYPRELINPRGLGYSAELDTLLVADPGAGAVHLYSLPGLVYEQSIGQGLLINPLDAAIDPMRSLIYVLDAELNQVVVFDIFGTFIKYIGTAGSGRGELNVPTSISIDSWGNLYVVDSFNYRVQVFTSEGRLERIIGRHANFPMGFSAPYGIALDSMGRVFVTDSALSRVSVFDSFGFLEVEFGSEGNGKTNFMKPKGIYIDQNDVIYIIDQGNKRIRIFNIFAQ